jgi:hypothetical protein
LRHQFASEARRILDNDRADAIALDPIEQRREARPRLNRVRAANGRIIEPGNQLEAATLGEGLDRGALPLLAVFILADIGRRRCANVADSFFEIALACRR